MGCDRIEESGSTERGWRGEIGSYGERQRWITITDASSTGSQTGIGIGIGTGAATRAATGATTGTGAATGVAIG